jgi:hypothetical protein
LKNFFKLIAVVLVVLSLSASWLVTLERISILKATQRVNFAKLLKNESISDKVSKVIYTGLKADFCGLTKDQDTFIFSLFLKSELDAVIADINNLIITSYSIQEQSTKLNCK